MKPLSVTSRIVILITIAIIFGASMIALSLYTKSSSDYINDSWDNEKKIERTFNVQPDGILYVDADFGDISVTGTDSEILSVIVYLNGAEDQLKRFEVKFDQNENKIKVKAKYKQSRLRFFSNNTPNVVFEIKVPKNFNLNLQTAGGNIEVTSVIGKVNGETSGGNIDIFEVQSSLKMSTSGGNVSIKKSKGDFKLETSGGNMYCDDVVGPLFMETSGGNINIKDFDGKLNASTSGGNIFARLKANEGIVLSTSGGNITIELPRSINATVKAEAVGGDVSCDLEFSGKIKDGVMNGKINGGGQLIRLETSGGDIVINAID